MTAPAAEPARKKLPRWLDWTLAIGLVLAIPAGLVALGRMIDASATWAFSMVGLAFIVRVAPPIGRWLLARKLLGRLIVLVTAQLWITDPLWLQHFHLTPSAGGALWWSALMVIGFFWFRPAILVAGSWLGDNDGGFHLKTALPPGWLRRIGWHRWLLGIVLFFGCAAHLTRYVNQQRFAWWSYAGQLGLSAICAAMNAIVLLAIFVEAPVDKLRSIRERFARLNWDRVLPWILAAWTVAASLLLGWVALDQVPHIPDELCYIFQAECLARGMFWGPAPPNPEAFKVYLITSENGRWFATTSPGWPAVLALGYLIGAPWLINPLLGGLAVLLAHALTRRLLGVKAAHLAAFLLSVSPWLLYLSASYMTHPLSLVLMLGIWLCLVRARDPSSSTNDVGPAKAGGPGQPAFQAILWSLLAGALLGWSVLVRQLDSVLFGAITGLWMLGLFSRRMPWSTIVAFSVAAIGVGALILPYNRVMTGDPFLFPLNAYMDKLWYPGINRLGFGADIGNPTGGWGNLDPFPGHGLRDVLINTNQNLYATNFELFGWCIGSFFFAALHVFFGKKNAIDKLMIFTIVVLFLGYHLYWYSGGPDFGARYWYLMIYPLVILTVRGIGTWVEGLRKGSAGDTAPERVGVVVAVLTLIALAVFIPWRAVTRYKGYRGFHDDYVKLEKSLDPRALVFVKTKEGGKTGDADFSSAVIRNSPRQDEPHPIFAQDLGDAENRKMIVAFPDRPVVYVTGRSMGTGPTRIEARR